MKKFFQILGWVSLGVLLQFKLNVLYGIVFLENLNFHDRTYFTKMNMTPTEERMRVLHVETIVHHSLGADYFANVYVPSQYKVLNKKPYLGAEAISGYQAYKMDMKRRYRDVLSATDFIISPAMSGKDIPSIPVLVHFENLKQLLHTDESFVLKTSGKKTQLTGPEQAEKTYPQKLGM